MAAQDTFIELAALETLLEQMKQDELQHFVQQFTQEWSLNQKWVETTISLLDEGNTIPFIARYRKEMTGEMDELRLRSLEERLHYVRGLEERKREVLRLIAQQGKLTGRLRCAVVAALKLQEIEDLYRPYRQKRKTRASVAKERGLEPLADWILGFPKHGDALTAALAYVIEEKGVSTPELAILGALDIIAERIGDEPNIRAWVRRFTIEHGILRTEAKNKEQESVYEMYYEYVEPIRKLPSHRTLAINRGEREQILKVAINVSIESIIAYIEGIFIRRASVVTDLLKAAIEDAYKRLIAPSIERDVRNELTDKAEQQAIQVFAQNLRSLLLQPPVKGKTVLGVDPAFRTGCKLTVVDETGKMLKVAVTYPNAPHYKLAEAETIFSQLTDTYDVQLIVIGNGTASRETEQFVANWINTRHNSTLQYIIVNEAGASVYSASKLAQEEFPALDVAERSAISIARRIQDPLAELVKIDPKAIGVGQYQHDIAPKKLEESLGAVVESAVNHVGVDVNTASPSLLSYVSGVNATLAKRIVKYREENGKYAERWQLQKVPRLGPKAFEQCVGFMRIVEGDHPLDNTPIHPEAYNFVDRLLVELGLGLDSIGTSKLIGLLQHADVTALATKLDVGAPTLGDIIDSLLRPGRDPREGLPPLMFRTDVLQIEDLTPGMELKGTVRNVIDFGAFVDIGIKNDGLVHISQLSDRYVKHPLDAVSVGDLVTVWVLQVDINKGRVGLTMKRPNFI